MTVRKWSFEEERILAEVYFRLEQDWPVAYIVREVAEELGRHGYERPDSAIRAKIYDAKKVDEGLDLSHVSKTTIQAYLDCPGHPVKDRPLLEELRSSNLSGQSIDFGTQFLSANNPFANVRYDTDPMEDRPTWDFQEYFNDVIENLDFFRHIKWSTIYTFAEAMCEETTYEWDCPLAEKVRREAHALLACKWTPSGYVDVYNSVLAYHLINSDVTFANRMILADLFADYIIGEGDL